MFAFGESQPHKSRGGIPIFPVRVWKWMIAGRGRGVAAHQGRSSSAKLARSRAGAIASEVQTMQPIKTLKPPSAGDRSHKRRASVSPPVLSSFTLMTS